MSARPRRSDTRTVWRTAAALPACLVLLLLPARSSAQAPFTLGSFTELRRGPDGGEVWRGVVPGATRKSMVYVPPGFLPERRYAVIYLLHGMPGSPWSYVNSLSLAALSDRVDGHLPIDSAAEGRTLAGLSAGGDGAIDVALRHPRLSGRLESWGGSITRRPRLLARNEAAVLRRLHMRFYLSSGPAHGSSASSFARELAGLRLSVRLELLRSARQQWERQLDEGLRWAEPST